MHLKRTHDIALGALVLFIESAMPAQAASSVCPEQIAIGHTAISGGNASFTISDVNESGMTWTRDGVHQGANAPHPAELCRHQFHGTFNPEHDFDIISYDDSVQSGVMDLDRLTAVLADRLSAVVPAGFHVVAADGMLWYSAEQGRFPGQSGDYRIGPAGTYVRDNFGVYGASDEDHILGVGVQALDELQDYISEATHTPWPGTTSQPIPHGQILNARLNLWYGDHDNPILVFEPIPLTDL